MTLTMTVMTRCAAGLLAGALLAACALTPKLAAPRLSVTEVQIVSSDLWEQRLRVRMHVQNPNDRALPVKGLEYTIEVEGQQFASGVSAASFTVPALGEAEFDMNVTTNLAGALLKLLARGPDALGQSVAYRLAGKVSLSEGLLRSIPFEERGTFTLR
jgi:LEA14-like dessication related protein